MISLRLQTNHLSLRLITILVCSGGFFAPTANANDYTPTFFLNAIGGFSVYESGMVQSTTTSTTVGYSFGVYAGQQKTLGMAIQNESSAFAFTTAGEPSGKLALSFQDTILKYRLGPVHVGAIINRSSWVASRLTDPGDVTSEVQDYLNIQTSGYGVNTTLEVPIGKSNFFFTDIKMVMTGAIQESALEDSEIDTTTREVAVGNRMDVDVGGSFALTRNLFDGIVGFKHRTLAIEVDGEAYAEQHNVTYFGASMSFQF